MATPLFKLGSINSAESTRQLQYIIHEPSGLKIIVYPLQIYPLFEPDPNELQFFGQLFQWWHAFETWDYAAHQDEYITAALKFYAEMKFYPDMLPTLIDPRRKPNPNVN